MEKEPTERTDIEIGKEMARVLIRQLLSEVSDSWNGSGIRIKLGELLKDLDE